jgi:hypothetical protein
MFSGRQDIEKRYADTFRRWPITDFTIRERTYLNALDNAVWSAGQWAATLLSEGSPAFSWGYWSAIYVPEGDGWKIRLLSLVEHPWGGPFCCLRFFRVWNKTGEGACVSRRKAAFLVLAM